MYQKKKSIWGDIMTCSISEKLTDTTKKPWFCDELTEFKSVANGNCFSTELPSKIVSTDFVTDIGSIFFATDNFLIFFDKNSTLDSPSLSTHHRSIAADPSVLPLKTSNPLGFVHSILSDSLISSQISFGSLSSFYFP